MYVSKSVNSVNEQIKTLTFMKSCVWYNTLRRLFCVEQSSSLQLGAGKAPTLARVGSCDLRLSLQVGQVTTLDSWHPNIVNKDMQSDSAVMIKVDPL